MGFLSIFSKIGSFLPHLNRIPKVVEDLTANIEKIKAAPGISAEVVDSIDAAVAFLTDLAAIL